MNRRSLRAEAVVRELLSFGDIQVGGERPWDIEVKNNRFYERVLADSSLGLGESYMEGWWDCRALEQFAERLDRANLPQKVRANFRALAALIAAKVFNLQSRARAFQVGEIHYDVGNDLYREMLDSRLVYSCAFWHNAVNLEDAQEAKLELICRKLKLERGMRLLDIGCGWGAFAIYAAQKYGVEVVGVTVSREQFTLARELARDYPVHIQFQDYRDIQGHFDRIVSIGMVEHVGHKNYGTFMRKVSESLEEDGIFLLHSICSNTTTYTTDAFTEKYIFPNGKVPSLTQLSRAAEGLFVIEDIHNIGPHYARTLLAWADNLERAWPRLEGKYSERFRRMRRYWLRMSAGTFTARRLQVHQFVMTHIGRPQPTFRTRRS